MMFIFLAALACSCVRVRGDYVLEVLVTEYRNPTSRCASCVISGVAGCCDADQSAAVCSGTARCDNYFWFCIRPFESEPNLSLGETECPLGRVSTPTDGNVTLNSDQLTFSTGETALNGLPNPLPFAVAGSWTGETQLFIEVRDYDPPLTDDNPDDPVDRFFIDRDDIMLGADFPTAMRYDGRFRAGVFFLSFRVNCTEGFTGENCTDLDPCVPTSPCQNGGTCTSPGPAQFECRCVEGYEGMNCELMTDECSPNPCQNGGTCVDLFLDYECDCAAGHEGMNCELMTDECSPNPCLNGGTCTDLVAGHSCSCVAGFSGGNCEVDIDDCQAVSCSGNGRCQQDEVGTFTCVCQPEFTGQLCDIQAQGSGSEVAAIVGGTVAAVMVVVVVVVVPVPVLIAVIVLRRKKAAGPKSVDIGPGDNPTYEGQSSVRSGVNEGDSDRRDNTGTSQSVNEVDFENPLYASASAGVNSPTAGEHPYATVPVKSGSQYGRENGHARTDTGTSSVDERDFNNPLYDAAEEKGAIPVAPYATLEPGSGSYDYMQWQAQPHNVAVSHDIYEIPQ